MALNDKEEEVRERAAYGLFMLGTKSEVPKFVELLNDKNAVVRVYSVKALGKLGGVNEIPYLEKVAENQRSNVIMGDVFLRMYVAGA